MDKGGAVINNFGHATLHLTPHYFIVKKSDHWISACVVTAILKSHNILLGEIQSAAFADAFVVRVGVIHRLYRLGGEKHNTLAIRLTKR